MNLGQTVLCFVNWYPILLWSRFYSVRTKILTNWSVLWHRRTTPFWQIRYHYWKMFLQNTTRVVSLSVISSVKPFKSKNRDKIYLDAPNTNLKKRLWWRFLSDSLTYKQLYGFIGCKVQDSSNKISSQPFFRFVFGASR